MAALESTLLTVLLEMLSTTPRFIAALAMSDRLNLLKGRLSSLGREQAIFLMAVTCRGGKSPGTPTARQVIQSGKTIFRKTTAPFYYYVTAAIQLGCDLLIR